MAPALCTISALLGIAVAHPSWMVCNITCMEKFTPGGPFPHKDQSGAKDVPTFEATTGTNCVIRHNIPADGYTPGTKYKINVTSTQPLARKLSNSAGGLGSLGQKKTTVADSYSGPVYDPAQYDVFPWTAMDTADVTFRAICGRMGEVDKMYVADAVTIACNTASTSCPAATVVPSTKVSSFAPALGGATSLLIVSIAAILSSN